MIESVLFSVIGRFATSEVKSGDLSKSQSDYKKALQAEKRSLTPRKSNAERDIKKAAKRFAALDADNDVLHEIIKEELNEFSSLITGYASRLCEIDGELALYENELSLGDVHNRAILDNLDALQKDLTLDERAEILKLCVNKIVLKAQSLDTYKRAFTLVIYPTKDYVSVFQTSALEVLFSLDNSKGKGEWIITSPFELKCDNFGKMTTAPNKGKIKRHWLHEVARWKKEHESGVTLKEIGQENGISESMAWRKVNLWDKLSMDVIEHILKLKYEKDIEGLSFRKLDALSNLPKARQEGKLLSML